MKDIYTEVTNRIVAALEHGTPPWVCPWRQGSALPNNLATGKAYRGVNVLILAIEAMNRNFTDNRWLTFRQANALGARIRQGEHGTAIVFYRMHEISESSDGFEDLSGEVRKIPLLKTYVVFNADQLNGLPDRFALPPHQPWQPLDIAEQLIEQTGAQICHGGNQAFYRPSSDTIQLPPMTSFAHADDYYATALHELTHWTGHSTRLSRLSVQRPGIEAYAFEELVAEIGAAFLCAHCGLNGVVEHASYIETWLNALRRDKRLIFVAAGAAQKAADFVMGTTTSMTTPVAEEVAA
ncbi:MAG: zincin-like metallopeptidase domain-containing protein [Nitrosomonas ureae]